MARARNLAVAGLLLLGCPVARAGEDTELVWNTAESQLVVLQIFLISVVLGALSSRLSFPRRNVFTRRRTAVPRSQAPRPPGEDAPSETLRQISSLLPHGPVLLLPLPSRREALQEHFKNGLQEVWLLPLPRPSALQVLLALEALREVRGTVGAVVVEGTDALEEVVSGPAEAALQELRDVCPVPLCEVAPGG